MRFVLMFLYIAITLALTSRIAMALDPENRVLAPRGSQKMDRSPAEAGLESGRYQEVEPKDLKAWEQKQESTLVQEAKSAKPAKD